MNTRSLMVRSWVALLALAVGIGVLSPGVKAQSANSPSSTQSFGIGARAGISGGGRPASVNTSQAVLAAANASFNTDFNMLPSVTSTSFSPYGTGLQTLDLEVFCFDLATGNILPNCQITGIVPSVEPETGGHLHNTNRPAGSVNPNTGNTGPSGFLPVVYSAPDASGITDLTITGFVNGLPPTSGIVTIGVEVDGLQFANINGFIVDTQSNMHGNNNGNAFPEMTAALQETADRFQILIAKAGEQYPTLHITAISLPQGGLFDYKNQWSPPHFDHRVGIEADISPTSVDNLSDAQRDTLQEAFTKSHLTAPIEGENPDDEGANHWHLRLPL